MVALTALVLVLLLAGLFYLFRAMGTMGQQPSPHESSKHTASEGHPSGPRASGRD